MTTRFEVTKPFQVTKRRCAMRTPKGKPKGRAPSTAAVTIDGADSKGKANDKEVRRRSCGEPATRSEAPRRRAAAIQERLDKIKPVAKAPVSAAALAADHAAMQRVHGIVAKTAVLSRSGCVHALVLYGFNRFIKQLPQLLSVVVRVEMILQ